jgi:branched-chain amino acid transport system ATP-binding protein
MKTPLLEVQNLNAWYGSTQALFGVSFTLNEGEITTILGANGAGKTTTLRAMCQTVRTSGSVKFAGSSIDGRSTDDIVRRGIAHVPDGRGTFTALSVEENLRLGAYVRKDKQGVEEDIERMYQTFPRLKERFRQQAGTLSGGEQQMLAISRALMLRPKLLLLDEPSFGLAPLIVLEIFQHPAPHQRDRQGQHAAGRAERLAGAGSGHACVPARDRDGRDVGTGARDRQGRRGAQGVPGLLSIARHARSETTWKRSFIRSLRAWPPAASTPRWRWPWS